MNKIMGGLNELVFEEIDEYSYIPDELANASWVKPAKQRVLNEFYCQMSGYDAGLIYKCKLAPLDDDDEPFVLDDEEPVTTWLEQDQRIYVGYTNGKVRAFYLKDDSYTDQTLTEDLPNHHKLGKD